MIAIATNCSVCKFPADDPVVCRCGSVFCPQCAAMHACQVDDARTIDLYDYQHDLVRGAHGLIRTGQRRIVIVLSTGGGKRYIQCWWAMRAAKQGKRVLFVVNRRTLVRQFSDELRGYGIPHNVLMGDETTPDRGESIVVASIQTLRRRHFFDQYGTPSGIGLPPADLILVDEAHLDLEAYKTLFGFYPGAIVIGATATPVGPGGKSLADIYPAMHVGIPKSELIARGRLVPTVMYAPSEPDVRGVTIRNREFSQGELEQKVRECTVFAHVFNEWQAWSDLPTVAFVPGVDFARWLAQEWNRRGYVAECIDAKTKMEDRERIFAGVKDRSIRVVLSVDVLKIGVDVPAWECGIDLQPTMQLRSFIQKTGRVCRAAPGKTQAIWLDFSGNFWRCGHPDEDIAWDKLESDETVDELMARHRATPTSPTPIVCPKCKLVRKVGSKCPQCGYEAPKVVRLVRMGDGHVKAMAPPRPKSKKEPTAKGTPEWQNKQWKSALFAAGRSDKTMKQARAIYCQRTGEWPPYGLELMPENGSPDWTRKVRHVYAWTNKRRAKA